MIQVAGLASRDLPLPVNLSSSVLSHSLALRFSSVPIRGSVGACVLPHEGWNVQDIYYGNKILVRIDWLKIILFYNRLVSNFIEETKCKIEFLFSVPSCEIEAISLYTASESDQKAKRARSIHATNIKCFNSVPFLDQHNTKFVNLRNFKFICLTSLTRSKCGIPSTLCWKIPNISGSIELFAL